MEKISLSSDFRNIRRTTSQISEKTFACLCCYDTGLVQHPQLLDPSYDPTCDVPVICHRPGCYGAQARYAPKGDGKWDTRDHLNRSASFDDCQRIHDALRGSYEGQR